MELTVVAYVEASDVIRLLPLIQVRPSECRTLILYISFALYHGYSPSLSRTLSGVSASYLAGSFQMTGHFIHSTSP